MKTVGSVSSEDARRVIAAGEAKVNEIGQPLNIAVADVGGNLVAHIRMDGAWLGSIDVSINKAFTAPAFDISTADLATNAAPGQQFYGIHASNHDLLLGASRCGTATRWSARWGQRWVRRARSSRRVRCGGGLLIGPDQC